MMYPNPDFFYFGQCDALKDKCPGHYNRLESCYIDDHPGEYKLPESKETNPKDAVGVAKAPMSTVPTQVIAELGIAMMEGARKYGRSNYRIAGCRSSVYYDAAMRHLMAWWEGQDIDPDSGLSHVSKAIASLAVLRDCQINGNAVDDRPPSVANKEGWVASLNGLAKNLIEKYPEPKEAFTIKK